jgi:hypothetical protein
MQEKAWHYQNPICTGLGDRLGIVLSLSALASLHHGANSTVYMEWCSNTMRVVQGNPMFFMYIPGWTGWAYPNNDVQAHISLPSNVKFYPDNSSPPFGLPLQAVLHGSQAPAWHGIPQTNTLYWKALELTPPPHAWSAQEYLQAYYDAGKQLQSTSPQDPEPYIVIHIRGPDHNTYRGGEGSFCTRYIIKQLQARVKKHRLRVISNNYTHSTHLMRGLRSIETVHGGSALSDLQILLGATGIVQHASEGWSSYSSVPAMAKAIPLINTYTGLDHRYKVFARYGEVPPEFHMCDQLAMFIDRLVD